MQNSTRQNTKSWNRVYKSGPSLAQFSPVWPPQSVPDIQKRVFTVFADLFHLYYGHHVCYLQLKGRRSGGLHSLRISLWAPIRPNSNGCCTVAGSSSEQAVGLHICAGIPVKYITPKAYGWGTRPKSMKQRLPTCHTLGRQRDESCAVRF